MRASRPRTRASRGVAARRRGEAFFTIAAIAILGGCTTPAIAPQPGAPPIPPPAAPAPQAPPPSAKPAPEKKAPAATIERGLVSLYGGEFAGKKTASGEPFDPEALTMAHRTLPFGTHVRVTNVANGRSVDVVVNDRGPAVAGRIADLSLAAARRLGMVGQGVIEALLEVIEPAH